MPNIFERFRHAWNAFRDPVSIGMVRESRPSYVSPTSTSVMPGNVVSPPNVARSTERTFVNALYTRIAIDCAAIDIEHVIVDDQGRYLETVEDDITYIFGTEANIDQSGRVFKQELFYNLFTEGVIVATPTLTDKSVWENTQFEIKAMRVGIVEEWKPDRIKIKAYNDMSGKIESFYMPKYAVCVIPNPLQHVMNDPNSSLKRLIHKLNLLDKIDDQSGSGKLDMIIQLPYSLRNEAKREWAAERKKDIEDQINNSKYGIAYIDAAEHIQQINRPLENNLQTQIEYLTNQVYAQLGLTEAVFNGTANEQEMLNYFSRTIEPVLSFTTSEIKRKYLTKTARSQGHSIMFFRDPFKLVPVEKLADLADRMTRNEIMASNEFRAIIGYKASDQPGADELRNKNINREAGELPYDPNQEYQQEHPPEEQQYGGGY